MPKMKDPPADAEPDAPADSSAGTGSSDGPSAGSCDPEPLQLLPPPVPCGAELTPGSPAADW